MSEQKEYHPISFAYRDASEFDLYLPPKPVSSSLPLVIFFHGGGLVSGSHKQGVRLPLWLLEDCHSRGFAFASAGYSLLPKFTAFDILEDAKAILPAFCSSKLQQQLPEGVSIDSKRIAVVGSSAGAYLCRMISLHSEIKPAVLGLCWGMGGNFFLDDAWLHPRMPAFFTRYDRPPGLPGSDLLVDWFQDGSYLDHFTGQKGIADMLRALPEEERIGSLPENLKVLFPELRAKEFPPSFLIHGREDTAVLLKESEDTFEALKAVDTITQMRVVEGEHSLRVLYKTPEYQQSEHWPELQKEMCDFLERFIGTERKA